jgi:hypothetical protein
VLPVACTLEGAEGGRRLAPWRGVAAVAGAGRQLVPGKLTLRFRDLPGIRSELERLVDAERHCCSFLGWQLVQAEVEWHVEVTGTDEELQALSLAE